MRHKLINKSSLLVRNWAALLVLGAGLTACAEPSVGDLAEDEVADEAELDADEETEEPELAQARVAGDVRREVSIGDRNARSGGISRTNHVGSARGGSSVTRTVHDQSSSSRGRTVRIGGGSSSGRTIHR